MWLKTFFATWKLTSTLLYNPSIREDVKTEISLSKQKRYEQLAEQERILLGILNEASKVSQSQNRIVLYLYDTSSRKRYDKLVEDYLELHYKGRILFMENKIRLKED